ncbi:MAG: copper-binding protein [Betaproteobacteria bacterium]|nr:copper-binding protein [Betaproteobacteria bacterium]
MKRTLLIFALTVSSAAWAQHDHGMPASGGMRGAQGMQGHDAMPMEQPRLFDGEVRGVDRDSGKVTLQHESIAVLNIPAMTMAYPVKDASMLDQLKPGDKVRFAAVQQGRVLLITKIVPAN